MACLAVGYGLQFRGMPRNSRVLAGLWVLGASLTTLHIGLALWAFHDGSHANAVASTAQRTEDLLGLRVGAGIYANYVFALVWWWDAAVRWSGWERIPFWCQAAIDGFLIAMAIFASIVFAAGPIRYVGLVVLLAWMVLAASRRHRTPVGV